MNWYLIVTDTYDGVKYGAAGLYGPFTNKDEASLWEAHNIPRGYNIEYVRNQNPNSCLARKAS